MNSTLKIDIIKSSEGPDLSSFSAIKPFIEKHYLTLPPNRPTDSFFPLNRTRVELEGKTPAEKAGIGIEDQNKWLGLIKRALASP